MNKKTFHSIIENLKGLHIIIGTLGSGKKFFMKLYTTQHFQLLGKNILLSVTTSVITLHLSSIAITIHIAF
jgi:type II secretory ATPase GspE/PulE/Tfp pilus assembly ATPase PilB-like protein